MMNPQEAQQFQYAVGLAQAGRKDEAHAVFVQMLQQNRNNPDALIWSAYTSSNLAEARSNIVEAERLWPANPQLPQAKSWLAQAEQSAQPQPQTYQQPNYGQGNYQQQNYQQPNYGQPNYQQGGYQQGNYQQGGYQQAGYGQAAYQSYGKPSFGDRLSMGWQFFKQALDMLRRDGNLIKPSLYSLWVSIAVAIVLMIPLAAVYAAARNGVVLGVALFLVFLGIYFVTYFFSSMTISLVYQNITSGRSDMPTAWAAAKRKSGTILGVAAISAFFSTLRSLVRESDNVVVAIVGGIITAIIEAVWTAYTFFVLPVIMIEDLGVGAAVKRSTQIIKNNLLQVGIGYFGVSLVTGLIGFLVMLAALAISFVLFAVLSAINAVIGFIVAALVFAAFIVAISVFNSYIRTAYFTCLVVWAKSVETQGYAVPAPAPLQAVLNGRMARA